MANLYIDIIKAQLREIIEPIIMNEGYELLDLVYRREHSGWVLRLYIDKEHDGITIDDCSMVSHRVSTILDVKDLIPTAYTLEVSSPGLDRPLTTEKDFKRAVDKAVVLQTTVPVNGRSSFSGILRTVEQEFIVLDCGDATYRIPLEQVAKATYDIQL